MFFFPLVAFSGVFKYDYYYSFIFNKHACHVEAPPVAEMVIGEVRMRGEKQEEKNISVDSDFRVIFLGGDNVCHKFYTQRVIELGWEVFPRTEKNKTLIKPFILQRPLSATA